MIITIIIAVVRRSKDIQRLRSVVLGDLRLREEGKALRTVPLCHLLSPVRMAKRTSEGKKTKGEKIARLGVSILLHLSLLGVIIAAIRHGCRRCLVVVLASANDSDKSSTIASKRTALSTRIPHISLREDTPRFRHTVTRPPINTIAMRHTPQ